MGRILAIDYGTKRCGVAVTDELRIIASGLTTVETPNILQFLYQYLQTNAVDCFVLGKPLENSGEVPPLEAEIVHFIKALNTHFASIPVDRQDERFTSKIATKSMLQSGMKKKQRQNKALIDEISATLILQSYLDSIKTKL